MTNKYLEKASGLFSSAAKFGKDLTGKTVKDATTALKTNKTSSFLELNKGLKNAHADQRAARGTAKRAVAGAVGGMAAHGLANSLREKKAEDSNKYLDKVAGLSIGGFGKRIAVGATLGGASGAIAGGKDNRLKGAIAGAAAGGVAGSMFGRSMSRNAVGKTPGAHLLPKPSKPLAIR